MVSESKQHSSRSRHSVAALGRGRLVIPLSLLLTITGVQTQPAQANCFRAAENPDPSDLTGGDINIAPDKDNTWLHYLDNSVYILQDAGRDEDFNWCSWQHEGDFLDRQSTKWTATGPNANALAYDEGATTAILRPDTPTNTATVVKRTLVDYSDSGYDESDVGPHPVFTFHCFEAGVSMSWAPLRTKLGEPNDPTGSGSVTLYESGGLYERANVTLNFDALELYEAGYLWAENTLSVYWAVTTKPGGIQPWLFGDTPRHLEATCKLSSTGDMEADIRDDYDPPAASWTVGAEIGFPGTGVSYSFSETQDYNDHSEARAWGGAAINSSWGDAGSLNKFAITSSEHRGRTRVDISAPGDIEGDLTLALPNADAQFKMKAQINVDLNAPGYDAEAYVSSGMAIELEISDPRVVPH